MKTIGGEVMWSLRHPRLEQCKRSLEKKRTHFLQDPGAREYDYTHQLDFSKNEKKGYRLKVRKINN